MTVDTANYFSVALHDDQNNASGSGSGSGSGTLTPAPTAPESKEDRAARKARRIAEAVERSKKEYTAENVYTERGWFLKYDDRGVSKSKIDQQRLEFLTASLYYSNDPDHRTILAQILRAFEGESRPGTFPKELLDIGIRSALATGDTRSAAKLARSGSSSWRTQWAGVACTAYDALIANQEEEEEEGEAIIPLLSCISVGGPQYPLLTRLANYLSRQSDDEQTETQTQTQLLRSKVDDLIRKKRAGATRLMFEDEVEDGGKVATIKCPERATVDCVRLAGELGLREEHHEVLGGAMRKLEKATRSADEPPPNEREERGVREL